MHRESWSARRDVKMVHRKRDQLAGLPCPGFSFVWPHSLPFGSIGCPRLISVSTIFAEMSWSGILLLAAKCPGIPWFLGFLGGSVVKNLPANAGDTRDSNLIPEEEMTSYSNILAWKIPQTEEPGGLQTIGSQKSWMWPHICAHTETTPVVNLYVLIFLS